MSSEGLHVPREKLSEKTLNMHYAISSLMEELEAVDWYRQRADDTDDAELKAVMLHNAREEIEHAAMVLEWLRRNDDVFDKNLREYLFQDGSITDREHEAEHGGILTQDPESELEDGGSEIVIVLTPEETNGRLDKALAEKLEGVSRARLQALMADGALSFGGTIITDVSQKAVPGEYRLLIPPAAPAEPAALDIPLTILFEDAHLIVVDKPAGMAAHPAPGTDDGTLVNALLFHCAGSLSGVGGVARPGIVHRLDKDTSGVMVAAKTDAAHAGLSALFAAHDIDRLYVALTRGAPSAMVGTIITQIGRAPNDRKKMAVLRTGGREATTHYTVEQTFGPVIRPLAARIACRLETGRTHQIRVHLASKGAPVLGDPLYGSGPPAASVREAMTEAGLARQALHAAVLGFVHPITGEALRFETKPPADMTALQAILEKLQ